jgi:hypothetical protein
MKRKFLCIKEIPVDLGATHPKTSYEELPNHEFSMGLIAPKGAGKTTLICNLLNFYKGYFHNIIVFSPTVKNDEKWDWVKKQPLLCENKPLQKWFKTKSKETTEIVEGPRLKDDLVEKYCKTRKLPDGKFDPKIPEEHFIHEYDSSTLQNLLMEQQELIDLLKEQGVTKHLANRLLFLFDDLVGSSLFGSERTNPFKILNTTHRHFSCSIIMVSQAYKEIPKTVRTNFSCLILFEIYNDKEIDVICEEYPMGMNKNKWIEAYRYAVRDPHAFLFYNIQKPKELRVMKNFSEVLMIK